MRPWTVALRTGLCGAGRTGEDAEGCAVGDAADDSLVVGVADSDLSGELFAVNGAVVARVPEPLFVDEQAARAASTATAARSLLAGMMPIMARPVVPREAGT